MLRSRAGNSLSAGMSSRWSANSAALIICSASRRSRRVITRAARSLNPSSSRISAAGAARTDSALPNLEMRVASRREPIPGSAESANHAARDARSVDSRVGLPPVEIPVVIGIALLGSPLRFVLGLLGGADLLHHAPERLLEVVHTLPRSARERENRLCARSIDRRKLRIFGQQVALALHHDVRLASQCDRVQRHLVAQLVEHRLWILGVEWHQESQHPSPLDVLQELQAEATALVGSLDDAGDVGHHERARARQPDDAEIRLQRREGIVGDLGTRGTDYRQQGAFSRIRFADKANIGDQLEHQLDAAFLPLAAGLELARGSVGGGGEVSIATTTAAAAREYHTVAAAENLTDQFAGVGVAGDRAGRNRHHQVGCRGAGHLLALAVRTALRVPGRAIAVVQQGGEVAVG